MGFNKRKMEERREQAAEKEAGSRRATDAQVLRTPSALSRLGTSAKRHIGVFGE
jgi:hypothetical protein